MLFYKALAPPIICINFCSLIQVFEVGPEYVAYTKAISNLLKAYLSIKRRYIKSVRILGLITRF
jgi:hypothetical protein